MYMRYIYTHAYKYIHIYIHIQICIFLSSFFYIFLYNGKIRFFLRQNTFSPQILPLREKRDRACAPLCEPSLRRFEALDNLCLDVCEHTAKHADAFCRPAEAKGHCFDVDFDFVPVQKEAHLWKNSHEEALVCKDKVRVSSSFGYAVPRSCGGSTHGSHSLRVSTSSFCSSQDTVVDDSEYRVPARSESRKHCAEVLASVVSSFVASGDEDTAFFLRSKAHFTRASRPPLSPPYATSAYNEQLQRPFGYLPQTKAGTSKWWTTAATTRGSRRVC